MRATELLMERVIEISGMRAWLDPTKRQLLGLAKRHTLRGTVVDGHVYVWEAEDTTHYDVNSWLVGYTEDYSGDTDFMIGAYDDMPHWTGNDHETEIAPGIFFSANVGALQASSVLRTLKPANLP